MKNFIKRLMWFYVLYSTTYSDLPWRNRLRHAWIYRKNCIYYPHIVFMDDYEVANVKALFEAMGYGTWDNKEKFISNPLQSAQNGDWVGQIYYKLPKVNHPPNQTSKEIAQNARNWAKYHENL